MMAGMAFHTYPLERADQLEDVSRFRYGSREELVGALDLSGQPTVMDIGSGTGFYTDEVAPFVETCYAIDVQTGMHRHYRKKGVPANVRPVTAIAENLPFDGDRLDGAFSTMTYHEFATEESLTELQRVIRPGGQFVTIDWTSEGTGESGPPLEERFDLATVTAHLTSTGYEIQRTQSRPETFFVAATVPR